MDNKFDINLTDTKRIEGFEIFTFEVSTETKKQDYQIYISDKELSMKGKNLTPPEAKKFAGEQMTEWLGDSNNDFPKDSFRILINGGKITTDNIDNFLSIQKKTSDLVRTNVTIAAQLFEWAKIKAGKEGTSFSELVSRGLLTLKESDKEIGAWFKSQGVYFRKKLGDFASFEVFHYLPNNYEVFDTADLKDAIRKSELRKTGWPIGLYDSNSKIKPEPQEDGLKAEYSAPPRLILDYWYAKNKGEFYFSRNLESDTENDRIKPKTTVFFDTLIWRVAESLEHCIAYYENLEIDEEERIKLKISLYGIENRTLGAWNIMRAFTLSHYSSSSNKTSWEMETSLKDLKESLDETIYESIKKLLVMFDFFVPNKGVVFDILRNEYRKSNF